jgi:hypothetical protein
MFPGEVQIIEFAIAEVAKGLSSITPEQEKAAVDLINKKIGGNEPLELAVIKGMVATAQAVASVLPELLKL